ncbi:hypothetical protein GIB67_007768 [Kingdonia uniflora]|uniref:Uncharacterized protein n=1 Tax=Kingdonia uniflora TaxID=39325 RepID=A0A7J7N1Y5_9MAGN|nr:hypothetical protein GIB67_007768 [Kingdonia uniflora]
MAKEANAPNKKKKVEGLKKEAFADEQFDHVPLIQLKALISKIPKKGLANRVPKKRRVEFIELENIQSTAKKFLQQVAPREILEVVNNLMVDYDVEVGRKVNFNAISSEYGGDLLESMVVVEVAKTDIVFFNQEEVVGEAYQVIDVYIKSLIQYFDTQHHARPDKERIVLADIFACQYIGRAFNVWTRNISSPEDLKIPNGRKKKKLSSGHQLIEDQISTIFPNMLIWRDFVDRSSPPTGSEVNDYGLNSKWITPFGKCPIQPNGNNCGVYKLIFMDNHLSGMKFPDLINGNKCHYTIAYDILRLGVELEKILKL